MSVFLALGLAVGCGDDDPGTVQPGEDAGTDGTLSTGSSNSETSSTEGSNPVDTTTDPGEETSTSSEPSSTDGSNATTTDGTMSPVDGGDGSETPTTEVDGSVGDSGSEETSTADGDGGTTSPADDGGAAACGAQGELCCASGGFGGGQGTCDEGLECDNPAGEGLANSECVVEVTEPDDGGAAACGAQGELCCASGGFGGGQGTCDEGFECSNPAGEGLANSECVAEVIISVDAGDAGEEACGGEGEVCCASGGFGGTCDEGFECDNPAGQGLANSECVAP